MKNKVLVFLPYVIALAAAYYLLPLLIMNSGIAILMLLCVVPIIVLTCGVVFGIKHGFSSWLPLIAAVLFIPVIFLYMNGSAWPYSIVYGIISLVGMVIGRCFYGRK